MEYSLKQLSKKETALDDKGTMKIPIINRGACSSMSIVIEANNSSGGNLTNPLLGCLKTIALVTEKDNHMMSLDVADLVALNTLQQGIASELNVTDVASEVPIVRLNVLFGRYKGDSMFGLNLDRDGGLHLELEYDMTIVRATGNLGYDAKSLKCQVFGNTAIDGKAIAFQGCIRPGALTASKTTAVSAGTEILRSTKNMVTCLMYAYLAGTSDNALIRDIKLTSADGKNTLAEATFKELQRDAVLLNGAPLTSYAIIAQADGRYGKEQLLPLGGNDFNLYTEQLVAAGTYRLIGEFLV